MNPKDKVTWGGVYADFLEEKGEENKSKLIRFFFNKNFIDKGEAYNLWEELPEDMFKSLLSRSIPNYASVAKASKSLEVSFIKALEIIRMIGGNFSDNKMDRINELLGGFGVESVRGDRYDNYFGDSVAVYVNRGDQYKVTVIYNVVRSRFVLSDLEDFITRYADRYGIN